MILHDQYRELLQKELDQGWSLEFSAETVLSNGTVIDEPFNEVLNELKKESPVKEEMV